MDQFSVPSKYKFEFLGYIFNTRSYKLLNQVNARGTETQVRWCESCKFPSYCYIKFIVRKIFFRLGQRALPSLWRSCGRLPFWRVHLRRVQGILFCHPLPINYCYNDLMFTRFFAVVFRSSLPEKVALRLQKTRRVCHQSINAHQMQVVPVEKVFRGRHVERRFVET